MYREQMDGKAYLNDQLISYAAAVELMDDELREEIHAEYAPCSEQEFLDEYCRRHFLKYGEDFSI